MTMKFQKLPLIVLVFLLSMAACVTPEDFPVEPYIRSVAVSTSSIVPNEYFSVVIEFQDGDGDMGGTTNNIILTDKRTGLVNNFILDTLPEKGVSKGISGKLTIPNLNTCCIIEGDNGGDCCQPPCASLLQNAIIYEVQLVDRAGNYSNIVETSPIIIHCQ